jgi:hypothetical protein
MSGYPANTPAQAKEYRKQYMAYLALEAQNEAFNLMANQVYKQTGQPSRPPDMRTLTEKMADVEEAKVRLYNELLSVTDGQNALEAIAELSTDDVIFALQKIELIKGDLKTKFSRGVPALALVSYIKALMTRELATNGVSFPSQEATSQAILNAIQAGRTAGAPLPAFAPSLSGMEPIKPPYEILKFEPSSEPTSALSDFSFVPPRRPPPMMRELEEVLKRPSAPREPFEPKEPAVPRTDGRPPLSEWVLKRAGEMGINAAEIDELGRQQEEQRYAEASKRGITLFTVKDFDEFRGLPFTKVSRWYNDWSPLIPEIREIAENNNLLKQKGNDVGGLRPTDKTRNAAQIKQLLEPAFNIYLEKVDEVSEQLLLEMEQKERSKRVEPMEGVGMRRRALAPASRFPSGRAILGYGLGRKTVALDMTRGIQNTMPTYVPFGKYIINPNKLSRGFLEVKTLNGGKLNKYPLKEISPSLTKIMKRMLDDRMPDEYDFNEMDLGDQQLLYELVNDAKISDRLNIPTPKLNKDGEEMNRFEILKGQIIAGNDNRELVKEFKTMLLKLSNEGRVKKAEAREILMDLTALGY